MKKAKKWIVCTLLCTLCLQNASFAAEPNTEASALPAAPIPAASIAAPSLPTLSTTSRPSVTRASFDNAADTATLPASGGKLRITLFLGSEKNKGGLCFSRRSPALNPGGRRFQSKEGKAGLLCFPSGKHKGHGAGDYAVL